MTATQPRPSQEVPGYPYVGFRVDPERPSTLVLEVAEDRDWLSPDLLYFYGQARLQYLEIVDQSKTLLLAANLVFGILFGRSFTDIEIEER
jgi:hypothetical protein